MPSGKVGKIIAACVYACTKITNVAVSPPGDKKYPPEPCWPGGVSLLRRCAVTFNFDGSGLARNRVS
jgi:hypothetical protein